MLETSHPPVYYLPPEDIRMEYLSPTVRHTFCEFKGTATYWTLTVGAQVVDNVGWSYPQALPGAESIEAISLFTPAASMRAMLAMSW